MTEKRFVIKLSSIVTDGFVIIDKEKKYTFPVLDSTLNYMFCKALNELYEENEELKYNLSAYMVDLNNYKGKCSALEIENEQLRKRVKELELLNDGLNYALQNIRKIDVEIDVGDNE